MHIRVKDVLTRLASRPGDRLKGTTLRILQDYTSKSVEGIRGHTMGLDPLFDPGVLEQLKCQADRYRCVELTPWVPEYMEKLCTVHESLRARLSADVALWDQTIRAVLDRARHAFEDVRGLAVVAEEQHHTGEYVGVTFADIYGEPIDWRKQLEAKNRDFANLSARYVTGHARR